MTKKTKETKVYRAGDTYFIVDPPTQGRAKRVIPFFFGKKTLSDGEVQTAVEDLMGMK